MDEKTLSQALVTKGTGLTWSVAMAVRNTEVAVKQRGGRWSVRSVSQCVARAPRPDGVAVSAWPPTGNRIRTPRASLRPEQNMMRWDSIRNWEPVTKTGI
ncbi:hypothetical protein BaRGS_00009897 [Batillaria attramentaria]|uniref:Uncharacterized protein n=1 Tax=Batillaria attramentaria TaxID=370345 RepID=A0ABD0LHE0_9CAEN